MNRTNQLIQQAQSGDKTAAELLLTENNGLIWSVAKRYIGRGAEVEDLYQLGCLGFVKAVDGFDLTLGTQFSTYAVPKIAGEIRRFLRDDGAVKVSRSIKEQALLIRSTRNLLSNTLGREPSVQEIATQCGLTAEQIAIAECATGAVESIHKETGEDGFTLENVLADTRTAEHMLEHIALRQAIESLSEREQLVIRLRYFHGLTQERIAKVLKVSQVQVSRIEKKSIQHLRERME